MEGSLGLVFIIAENFKEDAKVHFFGGIGVLDNGDDVGGLLFHIESLDGVDKLVNGDLSAAVIVEDVENLLHFNDNIDWHAFGGILFWLESLNKSGGY